MGLGTCPHRSSERAGRSRSPGRGSWWHCALIGWFARSEPVPGVDRPDYFTIEAGLAALAIAAAALWLATRGWPAAGGVPKRVVDALGRFGTAAALAVVATACVLLPGVFTDASLPDALPFIQFGHLPGLLSDYAAVGNGATPGVDFAAQYTGLLPYLLGPPLALFDYSPGAFTFLVSALSALALLALWRALALLARSELAGLVLYLPVLALSAFPLFTQGDERLANNSQYQILPERYLVPCLLAWVIARHLRGLTPRGLLPIFVLAGLGVANNPEFGGAGLAAALAALAFAIPEGRRRRELTRLVGSAIGGIAIAAAVVVAIDLLRAGSLPDTSLLTYYSRLFGSQGFGLIPMPEVGLHWILYLTFAGALVVAALSARVPDADRATTGLVAFAGFFGLVAGGYYAGRSNAYSLFGVFPAWGFALATLALVVWRRIRGAPGFVAATRRAGPLGIAILTAFGLATTTLTSVASPWEQVARINDHSDRKSNFEIAPLATFVVDNNPGREPIVYIGQNGHLIAREAGVRNVSLIGDPIHVISPDQVSEMLATLEAEGGSTVFVLRGFNSHEGVEQYLRARGLVPVARDPELFLSAWRAAPG